MASQPDLERVSERVLRNGDLADTGTPTPLLTLEEFFDGNDVVGSIGCNLPDEPGPQALHAVFQAIAQRGEVADVRISITDFDDPDWPFSDTVFIMTTATVEEVASWFPEHLAPDSVWEGFHKDQAYERYTPPAGTRPVACWWD